MVVTQSKPGLTYTECGVTSSVSRVQPEEEGYVSVDIAIHKDREYGRSSEVLKSTQGEFSAMLWMIGHLEAGGWCGKMLMACLTALSVKCVHFLRS